jgi:alkylated DNA repair protein alkB family protein 8
LQLQPSTPQAAAAVGSTAADADAAAAAMEALHVHQVYDAIAVHFSATRFAVWPKVGAHVTLLGFHAVRMEASFTSVCFS